MDSSSEAEANPLRGEVTEGFNHASIAQLIAPGFVAQRLHRIRSSVELEAWLNSGMPSSITLHEVGVTPDDLLMMRSFYAGLYTAEFPDPDERESYDNMVMYLRGAVGAHANGYHIVLAVKDGAVIGASITDYFAPSRAGVVEFLVVAAKHRRSGLGKLLLQDAEARLERDAARGGELLRFIAAEINDPFRRSVTPDNVDPFERARWWGKRGFAKLDFPYVQPPLSAGQQPVRNLILAVKSFAPSDAAGVSAASVEAFIRDYLIYAMRIPAPASCAQFIEMSRWLQLRHDIRIVPLHAYIGEDCAHPVDVHELTNSQDARLDAALAVYEAAFNGPATALPAHEFRRLLDRKSGRSPYVYHFWALTSRDRNAISGMASFFTLPSAGFGGYVALVAPLRGTGALPTIVARIEQQFIRDSPDTTGWYIECAEERTAAHFAAQGFFEVGVAYRQPWLGSGASADDCAAPPLHLLYKEFGARYSPPALEPDDFIAAMHDLYVYVYGVAEPLEEPSYRALCAAAQTWHQVPFV